MAEAVGKFPSYKRIGTGARTYSVGLHDLNARCFAAVPVALRTIRRDSARPMVACPLPALVAANLHVVMLCALFPVTCARCWAAL